MKPVKLWQWCVCVCVCVRARACVHVRVCGVCARISCCKQLIAGWAFEIGMLPIHLVYMGESAFTSLRLTQSSM
jgi:hypothetical protein